MDQLGISDVTPEIVKQLAECSYTDILFFIPSSHVYRFKDHDAFKNKINLSDKKNIEYTTIHRHICEYFKEKLSNQQYHIAPFSIKEGSKIHGIIFGSGDLYGLEKFLKVCWDIDPKTGQANYPMDGDLAWNGQQSLFPEDNIFHKVNLFEEELETFVAEKKPDNIELYIFILEKGFIPKKANKILKKLQKVGWLEIISLIEGEKIRKGAFFLNHKEKYARIRFKLSKGKS